MRKYRRKINKRYQKFLLEIEDGLSTYDLQLLSLSTNSKKNKRIVKENFDDLLAA